LIFFRLAMLSGIWRKRTPRQFTFLLAFPSPDRHL
jgi:hypothetical protein